MGQNQGKRCKCLRWSRHLGNVCSLFANCSRTLFPSTQPADVNNDPEYVEVYSLPLFFANLFKNFSYLEYPALGRMPDPPANGYQPGRADLGELCCYKRTHAHEEEEEEVEGDLEA